MRRLLLLSPILVVTFISLIYSPSSKTNSQQTTQPDGTNSAAIKGFVTTSGGQPVSHATLYAGRLGGNEMLSQRNSVTTDDQGGFRLSNLPDGEYTLRAYKEADGYPHLLFSFYSEAYRNVSWPRVTIVNGTTVENVIVHVASPKCGRLLITVFDGETNQQIRDAHVSLNHEGKPLTLFGSGLNTPDYRFNLLVPPDIPIELKVSAPGHRDWHYNTDSSKLETKPLRLASDTTKELNVTLQRQK